MFAPRNPLDLKTPGFLFDGTYSSLIEKICNQFPKREVTLELTSKELESFSHEDTGKIYRAEVPPSNLRDMLASVSSQTGIEWYAEVSIPPVDLNETISYLGDPHLPFATILLGFSRPQGNGYIDQ